MAMNEMLVVPYAGIVAANTIAVQNGANLFNERMGRAATLAGNNNHRLIIDLGSPKPVNVVAMLATDVLPGATWRVYGGSAVDPVENPSYASPYMTALASPEGAKRLHRQMLHILPSTQTFRYWGLGINQPGSNIRVGRLVIGEAFTAADTMDVGFVYRVVDLGENRRTAGGLDDPTIRGKVLEYTWTWSWMTEQEARGALLDLLAYAGTTRNLLAILNPDAPDLHNVIGYGKFEENGELTNVAGGADIPNAYEASFTLQSRLILNL